MVGVIYKGARCVPLPGSDCYVTCEGTLLRVTSPVTKPNTDGYLVSRNGVYRFYSKRQLTRLYNKYTSSLSSK